VLPRGFFAVRSNISELRLWLLDIDSALQSFLESHPFAFVFHTDVLGHEIHRHKNLTVFIGLEKKKLFRRLGI